MLRPGAGRRGRAPRRARASAGARSAPARTARPPASGCTSTTRPSRCPRAPSQLGELDGAPGRLSRGPAPRACSSTPRPRSRSFTRWAALGRRPPAGAAARSAGPLIDATTERRADARERAFAALRLLRRSRRSRDGGARSSVRIARALDLDPEARHVLRASSRRTADPRRPARANRCGRIRSSGEISITRPLDRDVAQDVGGVDDDQGDAAGRGAGCASHTPSAALTSTALAVARAPDDDAVGSAVGVEASSAQHG